MRASIFRDLLILLVIFGVIWAAFTYFPIFPDEKVLEIPVDKEEKLGELIMEELMADMEETNTPALDSAIYVISETLLENIGLTDYEYDIKVVNNEDVNAITLPGGNILIFSGLIEFVESAEELSAVVAHEIGHVELRHVVKKLIKELGLTILLSVFTGNDPVLIHEIGKIASSTVFDRRQEKKADEYALELLTKSGINPRIMASFFRRLSKEYGDIHESLEFLSTHPNNNSRIKNALQYKLPEDFEEKKLPVDWERVKASLNTHDNS